jgi:MFS superfamily sulfate permease-like transporter
METQGPQFVRKHWSIILAYMVFASFATGLIVATIIALCSFMDNSQSLPGVFLGGVMGVSSVVAFVIQLLTEPLVFTKNVICETCHRKQKLARIPFFAMQGYRQPKCDDCGGDLDPAFFWELSP